MPCLAPVGSEALTPVPCSLASRSPPRRDLEFHSPWNSSSLSSSFYPIPDFLDSSAPAKRCVQEDWTSWVRGLTHRATANPIYLARITAVEVTAAVARRRKGKSLSSTQASSILSRFRKRLAARYTLLEMTPAVLAEAMKLANSHELRAYDAVQFLRPSNRADAGSTPAWAASCSWRRTAARRERLIVEDPTMH
jgi:predicted nucleic acid-binding protein